MTPTTQEIARPFTCGDKRWFGWFGALLVCCGGCVSEYTNKAPFHDYIGRPIPIARAAKVVQCKLPTNGVQLWFDSPRVHLLAEENLPVFDSEPVRPIRVGTTAIIHRVQYFTGLDNAWYLAEISLSDDPNGGPVYFKWYPWAQGPNVLQLPAGWPRELGLRGH